MLCTGKVTAASLEKTEGELMFNHRNMNKLSLRKVSQRMFANMGKSRNNIERKELMVEEYVQC